MSAEPSTILFQSDDLRATLRRAGGEARPLVVTFDSLNHDLRLERPGFGEGWLDQIGYDAVHVVARRNDWYQHPEMGDLFAAVREETARHPRAVTYGSSMGGYAAVRFAGRVGASTAIAISPQMSIDPERAPFDDRWLEHGRRLAFLWDAPTPEDALVQTAYVFYDPKDVDRLHVRALADIYPVLAIPLRNAGHPAGAYLAESGLLGPAVMAMIEGTFDADAFGRSVRDARRLTGQYHFTLALKQPAHRPETARRLAARAAELGPLTAPYLSLHARLLPEGREVEAERLHRRALELEPGHPRFHLDLAALLARTGRDDEAAALVRDLGRFGLDQAWIHSQACLTLFLVGEYEAALVEARAGRERVPRSGELRAWERGLGALLRWPRIGRPVLDAARRLALRPAGRLRARWTERLRRRLAGA